MAGRKSTTKGKSNVVTTIRERNKRIKQLKGLIVHRQQNPVQKYWELGDGARKLIDATAGTKLQQPVVDLAHEIDVEYGNLRAAMKFAAVITKSKAERLERSGVRWRGVMIMLGVAGNKKQLNDVFGKIVKEMTNSTEIRQYIEKHCKKKRPPRFSSNLLKACEKTERKVTGLVAVLEGFRERLRQESGEDTTAAERRKREKAFRGLGKALGELTMSVGAVKKDIKK